MAQETDRVAPQLVRIVQRHLDNIPVYDVFIVLRFNPFIQETEAETEETSFEEVTAHISLR